MQYFTHILNSEIRRDSFLGDRKVTLTLYIEPYNAHNTKQKGGEPLKRMLITLLFIFLSMTSCLNFAAANDDDMIGEDDEKGLGRAGEKVEEWDLSKHGLSRGRIVGIVMLVLVLLIVAIKYIRVY